MFNSKRDERFQKSQVVPQKKKQKKNRLARCGISTAEELLACSAERLFKAASQRHGFCDVGYSRFFGFCHTEWSETSLSRLSRGYVSRVLYGKLRATKSRSDVASLVSQIEVFLWKLETLEFLHLSNDDANETFAPVCRAFFLKFFRLKDLRDPENGKKLLAIGPFSKLRGALPALRDSLPPPPAPHEAAVQEPPGAPAVPVAQPPALVCDAELVQLLRGIGLEKHAPQLAQQGLGSVAALRGCCDERLKELRAEDGSRLLAIGPLSKLRSALHVFAAPAHTPALGPLLAAAAPAVVATAEPELLSFLELAGLDRLGEGLARCGVATLAQLRATPSDKLKDLRDPATDAKLLAQFLAASNGPIWCFLKKRERERAGGDGSRSDTHRESLCV